MAGHTRNQASASRPSNPRIHAPSKPFLRPAQIDSPPQSAPHAQFSRAGAPGRAYDASSPDDRYSEIFGQISKEEKFRIMHNLPVHPKAQARARRLTRNVRKCRAGNGDVKSRDQRAGYARGAAGRRSRDGVRRAPPSPDVAPRIVRRPHRFWAR
ncbi:hypothetical protein CC85DRAFT_156663 [Cutaneotrichosporon oleaginosum]|uniref:Uncharacterized protein n=1 Tax=Cutaneotrichosporon oleaginosum TaxID=879819 RepID=A0A0J0XGX9_9TREE|nr:uncharacterized protein CC85DRAFT_156663 [Cutaneotrichosporon oleaginosum]KLT40326.1 hypothetical protein CC85DRAFT_156663 [Cutaneotrichosporon oleaginosum]TXT06509.1 hypothetical protein COLE_05840 [Cutaneotrichosporon oleaginosum]